MSEKFFDPCGEAFERGFEDLQNGNAAESIAHFTHAIRLDPQYVNAYVARAFALLETGRVHAAIADCTTAIRLAPKLPQVFRLRASAYRVQGEHAKAEADLAQALELPARQRGGSQTPGAPAGEEERTTARLTRMLEGFSGLGRQESPG